MRRRIGSRRMTFTHRAYPAAAPLTRTLRFAMAINKLSATGLLAIAGLHAVWATGSSWPMRDGATLAEDLGGRPGGEPHTAAECLAVAGALTLAATFVAGRPRSVPALSRAGSAGVAAVLATRGAFGL